MSGIRASGTSRAGAGETPCPTDERQGPPGQETAQRPPSKYVAKDNRPAKRLQQEERDGSTPVRKENSKESICTICNGPHSPTRCDWKRDHCFRCGKPGHLRYTCRAQLSGAPPAPRTREVDDAAAQPRTLGDSQTRNRLTEEDPTGFDREGHGNRFSYYSHPLARCLSQNPYELEVKDSQPRNRPIEEDPSEEDPSEEESSETEPAERDPPEDPREDDPEEEDPEEDAPDEECPNEDNPTRADREGPESGSPHNSRPVVRCFGQGPYNFTAEDAQSRIGN